MGCMTERSLNELSNRGAQKFDSAPAAFSFLSLRRLATRLLPQACALCAAGSGDSILCAPCMNALPPLPVACPSCARPSSGGAVCGACLRKPPPYATTLAACSYAYPLDRLVQALKYSRQLALAQPLGDALAAAAMRAPRWYVRPGVLVALPLAAARQRERGFNQAIEIARVVARRTGIPLVHGVVRSSHGPPQATLPWKHRRRNVRSAFACVRSFSGLHVALVDDVMTTGATLEAAAGALLKAGAARVDAWVVARTLPPGSN
jgi:ComF family protein